MIITISGFPGSGKTNVGKQLAKILNYKFYSMGDLRGEIATKKGITINELNKLGETEQWTDKEIDDYQKELGKKEDNIILEGRLSFHFIPNSKKIFLNVTPEIGANRIFKDNRDDEDISETIEDLKTKIQERINSDTLRYKKYYNIDSYNTTHYNIIIDTSNITIQETVEQILKQINQ
jgi:CMP/dCMP kinase